MQHLRDNAGVLESSANGTTWTPVILEGTNPLPLGTLLLRDNAGVFELSDDDGATWAVVGSGGGIPAEIANPVMLGTLQIRDNAGVLETSPDGTTWTPVDGIPDTLASPVTIGTYFQLRDNQGSAELSDDSGANWHTLWYPTEGASLNLIGMKFYPPVFLAETQPTAIYGSALAVWTKQSTGQVWLMYSFDGNIKKVELT